jgi:phage tail protein domain
VASGAKSFVINRESDWKYESILSNLSIFNDILLSPQNGENGVYISGAFDSGQAETIWHRLRIDMEIPGGAIVNIRIYTSDTFKVTMPSNDGEGVEEVDINEYIQNKNVDINRKIDMLDYIGAEKYVNLDDLLMFNFKGRYLWICLEIINYEKERVKVKSVKIEFPRVSFVDYLPEIYREGEKEDSFLARYLGIFQSMYVDLEDRIDNTPINFDAERTSKDFLEWIADWISVKNASIWGEKKLRTLIKESVGIYKMKGTKASISKIVKEYTGIKPIIVEQFDIKNNQYYQRQKKQVENLFGDNGYVFTVILGDKYIDDTEDYVELLKVIGSVMPIDSICNLVVLSDKIYLDHHCYMGMNSYIAQNKELIIGENSKDTTTLMLMETNTK